VLHVITTISRGGAENQLLILAGAQIRSGRSVSVVFLKGTPDLKQRFESLGVKVHSELAGKNPFFQIHLLRRLIHPQDLIIHAHLPRAELVAAMANRGNNFFVSRHNTEPFFPGAPKILSNMLSKYVTQESSATIAISQAVKDYCSNRGEIAKGTTVIVNHYGINPIKSFIPVSAGISRLELSIASSDIVYGFVGRLVPQKDIPTLLHSFQVVANSIKNSKLLIIGDGYLKSSMQRLASSLEIDQRIIWVGKTDDVFAFMKLMDIFILTSKYEGFGLVLLEAMMNDLPIIASNNSAIPEVLGTDYQYLCETGNAQDFARSMINLTSSSASVSARKQLKNRIVHFSPSRMSSRMDAIYIDC
jgi:glycosyltransferase involved in cell wall biosynthesis